MKTCAKAVKGVDTKDYISGGFVFQVVLSLISTNKNLNEHRSAGYHEPSAESHGFEGERFVLKVNVMQRSNMEASQVTCDCGWTI